MRTSASTTTPHTATRRDSLRVIDAACRSFISGDAALEHGSSTTAGQQAFARGRLALVRHAELTLRRAALARSFRDVRRKVGVLLGEANALYARAETETDLEPLLEQGEDLLGQVVGALYLAGAVDCVVAAPSTGAAPPPPDAGALLPRRPVATITVGPVGADDNRIVADDDAVWVGLKNLDEMVRIDPRTDAVAATVPIGETPSGAPQIVDGYLWIPTVDDVLRIDPATNQIDRRIHRSDLGFGNGEVVVTADALVSCNDGSLVSVDPQTGALRSRAFVAHGCDELAIAGDEVWVLDGQVHIERVDPSTGSDLTVPVSGRLSWGALTFGDGFLWNQGDGVIERIDLRSGSMAGSVTRSGVDFIEPCFGTDALWLASEPEQRVIRVDAHTLHVTELAAGKGANAIGCSSGTVWVANSDESTVMRFDVGDLG